MPDGIVELAAGRGGSPRRRTGTARRATCWHPFRGDAVPGAPSRWLEGGPHPCPRHGPEDRTGLRDRAARPITPDSLAGPPAPATNPADPPRPLPPAGQARGRGGWGGRRAVPPGDGTAPRPRADAVFGQLVSCRPAGAAHPCPEPCSRAPDGLNLPGRGIPDAGRAALAPGEALSGRAGTALALRHGPAFLPARDIRA